MSASLVIIFGWLYILNSGLRVSDEPSVYRTLNFPIIALKFFSSSWLIFSKFIVNFSDLKVSPIFKLVITSLEKILLNIMLKINKLKPKWAMFWDKFFNLLIKNYLKVEKNKKKAEVTKIVLMRKLMLNSLIINADNKNDIIKNMII